MRLDLLVSEKFGVSRTRAQNLIKTGGVTVNGVLTDKPAAEVDAQAEIVLVDTLKYASLGGLKIENAIDRFKIDLSDKICLDVGAANGGFTDCMLKKGAKEVSALDLTVAFSKELSEDPRVKIYDGANAKAVGDLFEKESFDFVSVDLSFISLCGLFSCFYPVLKRNGLLLTLFKPQFEVGRKALPKSGVVRDKKAIEKAFSAVVLAAENAGFKMISECPVPEVLPNKNPERTVLFIKVVR
ncbi:MAG: TlyA family RNA methyltransferase [Clostridia bacterium]|nr:TlyA family RNA methyltransferase [Clostridia bacterium]